MSDNILQWEGPLASGGGANGVLHALKGDGSVSSLVSYDEANDVVALKKLLDLSVGGVFQPHQYGAKADGVTDDSAAIIACEAAAYAAGGIIKFLPGRTYYTGTTTVVIRVPCEGLEATILYAGTGIALQVGSATPILWRLFRLPMVVQKLKTLNGWAQAGDADMGVRLLNLYSSRIFIPRIANFAIGLDVRGEGTGNVYNHIYVGHLDNNKINQQTSADTTGWSNENNYYIGRWSFNSSEGTSVSGTRDVLIQASTNVANNNHWWGGAHEGAVQEFHVECYGADNSWSKNRWELPAGCKVRFNSANAVGNEINGGYKSSDVIITEVNGAFKNKLASRDYNRQEGSAGDAGVHQLGNTSGSAKPIIVGLPAGVRPSAAVDTDRTMKLSSSTLEGKTQGDVNPRFWVNLLTGMMKFCGDASLAAGSMVAFIRGFGSDGIQFGGKLGLFGVTPVSQPASANQAAVTGAASATYDAATQKAINDTITLANELRRSAVLVGSIKGSA